MKQSSNPKISQSVSQADNQSISQSSKLIEACGSKLSALVMASVA